MDLNIHCECQALDGDGMLGVMTVMLQVCIPSD